MCSKEVHHFTFQQFTLPAMYKSSKFSTSLPTLVIACLYYNHPSGGSSGISLWTLRMLTSSLPAWLV